MLEPINDFENSASSLTKNPLGIIGLFVSLIYGIACIVLVFSTAHLLAYQNTILICFIVLFPILLLRVFFVLVTKYNTKLYSPDDYKDPNIYIQATSDNKAVKEAKIQYKDNVTEVAKADQSNAKDITHFTQPDETSPAIKDTEIVSPLDPDELSSFIKNYVLLQDLVLRELEIEFSSPIRRQVRLFQGSNSIDFDGSLTKKGSLIGIEVKYINDSSLSSNIMKELDKTLHTFDLCAKNSASFKNYIVIIALVLNNEQAETSVKDQLSEMLKKLKNISLEVKTYTTQNIFQKYGIVI